MTGWYPDPGGQPDRYRYWDGKSWSEETSTDPADPAPGAPGRRRTTSLDEHRHDAAHSSMECAIRTSWYLHLTGHKTVQDEATTVAGRSAWILTWEVYDDTPGLSVRSDAYSMWCGMVPLGDTGRIALDQKVLAGLEIGG